MKTRTIELAVKATGETTTAELLLCPHCDEEAFVIYTPAGVTHVHFQCIACGVSFCDGCHVSPPAGDDVSPAGPGDGKTDIRAAAREVLDTKSMPPIEDAFEEKLVIVPRNAWLSALACACHVLATLDASPADPGDAKQSTLPGPGNE
jgi:hypothetical protein